MAEIDLSPAPVDLAGVRAGDRNQFQLTIRAGGIAVDLTGYTITAQARTSPPDVAHLDAVITILDATNGICQVKWPGPAVTTWLGSNETQKGVWDLQLNDGGGGDPWTVIAGSFAAELDVTRP